MKQIHVWPNHVAIPSADLVLVRSSPESVRLTLWLVVAGAVAVVAAVLLVVYATSVL